MGTFVLVHVADDGTVSAVGLPNPVDTTEAVSLDLTTLFAPPVPPPAPAVTEAVPTSNPSTETTGPNAQVP